MKVVYVIRNPGISTCTPDGWRQAVIASDGEGRYTREALDELEDAQVIVVGDEPINRAVFEAAPRLRLVQRLGVGADNVDLDEASHRGVPVCNMPHFNAGTVAEHVVMMILALQRRAFDSTLLMKAGRWPLGTIMARGVFDLQGKTVGVLGLGAIGRAVVSRLAGFEVELLYHDAVRSPDDERAFGLHYGELHEVLERSDIMTCHIPLTPATRGLLGRAELERMKPGALFINTARGALVDESALAELLKSGRIGGVGIDVFTEEPAPADHPLLRCENVILTPHSAGQTREAMDRMIASMLENLALVEKAAAARRLVRGSGALCWSLGGDCVSSSLPFVSVVVAALDADGLAECLASLAAVRYPPDRHEVLVVGADPCGATESVARGYPVTYLRVSHQSVTVARNRGIEASQGELVVLTDPDCVVTTGWLSALATDFTGPDVGMVAGAILPYPVDSLPERFMARRRSHSQERPLRHPLRPFAMTPNLAVRREVFERVGLFDTRFVGGGWEDADLCWRMGDQTSYEVRFAPRAAVFHRYRSTTGEFLKQQYRYGFGLSILLRKHATELPTDWWRRAGSVGGAGCEALSVGLAGYRKLRNGAGASELGFAGLALLRVLAQRVGFWAAGMQRPREGPSR